MIAGQYLIRADIVIDSGVMRLYDNPKDERIRNLFGWLHAQGVLAVNQRLVAEYVGQGNRLVAALLDHLGRQARLIRCSNAQLRAFKADRHFKYRCNIEDIDHARLVFISCRKRLVSFDNKLRLDINRFPRVNKIKPRAMARPSTEFFM